MIKFFNGEGSSFIAGEYADIHKETSDKSHFFEFGNSEQDKNLFNNFIDKGNNIETLDPKIIAEKFFLYGDSLMKDGLHHSNEQWVIAMNSYINKNIICKAVAGSGKTTTLFLCAKLQPEKEFLLLTYSKKLQIEVNDRLKNSKMKNLSVKTIHSAAGVSSGTIVNNDRALLNAIIKPLSSPIKFDVLMIDEGQDLTVEYHIFTKQLIEHNKNSKVIIVGDELQTINAYKGANHEFLTKADVLYGTENWVECTIRISWRLTPANANFVNKHLYNDDVIVGGNTFAKNKKPEYYCGDYGYLRKKYTEVINSCIQEYGHENIFVLTPSTANNKKKKLLHSVIDKLQVPVFKSSKELTCDDDVMNNKLGFITFNSAKGSERKCVIAETFSEDYFTYFDKGWDDPTSLPNLLTVAATRAKERLILFGSCGKTLRTVDVEKNKKDNDFIFVEEGKVRTDTEKNTDKSVTDYVNSLDTKTLDYILSESSVKIKHRGSESVSLKVKIKTEFNGSSISEDVSAIYGTVIPVLAEIKKTKKSQLKNIRNIIHLNMSKFDKDNEYGYVVSDNRLMYHMDSEQYETYSPSLKQIAQISLIKDVDQMRLEEWVALSVLKNALKFGEHLPAKHINNYDWFEVEKVKFLRDRLLSHIEKTRGSFEAVVTPIKIDGKYKISGRVDYLEKRSNGEKNIWEFKLGALKDVYRVQLIVYMVQSNTSKGYLYSILHDIVEEITLTFKQRQKIYHFIKNIPKPEPQKNAATLIENFYKEHYSENNSSYADVAKLDEDNIYDEDPEVENLSVDEMLSMLDL